MKAATWKNLPIEECVNVNLGLGEAALGASRLLNTSILGAAGAGQVISIIRGEESHTYGNVGVRG